MSFALQYRCCNFLTTFTGTTGRQPEILEESSGVISAETEEASTQIERNMSLRVVETNLLGRLRSQSHSPQLGKISPGDRHAKEQFGDPPENGDLGQGSRVPFTSSHSLKSPIRIKSAGGHLNVAQWNLEMSELKSNYQHSKVSPYHLADSIKGTGTATELNAQVATDGAEHRSSISAANIMANTLLESDLKEIKPAVLTLKTRGLPILNSEEYFPTSIRSERIDDVFSHHVLPSLYSVCSDSTITSEPVSSFSIKYLYLENNIDRRPSMGLLSSKGKELTSQLFFIHPPRTQITARIPYVTPILMIWGEAVSSRSKMVFINGLIIRFLSHGDTDFIVLSCKIPSGLRLYQ